MATTRGILRDHRQVVTLGSGEWSWGHGLVVMSIIGTAELVKLRIRLAQSEPEDPCLGLTLREATAPRLPENQLCRVALRRLHRLPDSVRSTQGDATRDRASLGAKSTDKTPKGDGGGGFKMGRQEDPNTLLDPCLFTTSSGP